MRRDWEDTFRAVGALLDTEPITRPALIEVDEGLHLQALTRHGLVRTLNRDSLEAVVTRARALRTNPQLLWTDLQLLGHEEQEMAEQNLPSRKNYEATFRQVGLHIEKTGMRGFILFESERGYLLRGLVPVPKVDGGGTVWEMREFFWSNTDLERIAEEAVRLRGSEGSNG